MAEDEDKPEDEIEDDDDDSDLFQPPPPDKPVEEDGPTEEEGPAEEDGDDDHSAPDPLGEALAEGAAEDAPGHVGTDLGEEGEEPAPGGHHPVLSGGEDDADDDNDDDNDDDVDRGEDTDLFSEADSEDDEDEDEDEDSDAAEGGARQRYPWLQLSGEEEEEPEEEHFLHGRALIIVGAGVVFVIFAALIWFLYAQGDEAPRDQDVALIEAPEGPAKVEPEDRGGMEVPDQDKLVFDRVSGQETELEDNLLDGPEVPGAVPTEALPETMDELVDALVLEEAVEETPLDSIADASPVEEPVAAPEPVETVTPIEPAPQPAAPSGTHMVQLGSFASTERAETAWRVAKNRHSITLAGLGNDIQRADLGARGIFYRLRTEALGEVDARDLCSDLKADGQDCLVVRR